MVSIFLLVLHADEASYVSSSSIVPLGLLLFVRFGLPKCLLQMLLSFLNLLDGPVDVDPAFYVIWSRFRMMRRFLASCPEEEPRISRMLDLISRGAQGHGPIHLILISAAELVLLGMGMRKVGFGYPSRPPLRMVTGPVQHFCSAILDAWRFRVFARLSERKGFGGCSFSDFKALYNYLTRPHLRDRDKMLLRAILCVGVWNGFLQPVWFRCLGSL